MTVTPGQRAARLLWWYPRAWRERYGDEFAELLVSDIAERPHAPLRVLDIARGGLVARLADLGLSGFPVAGDGAGAEPGGAGGARAGAAASLASLGACLAAFAVVGAGLWSQLAVGWQWSAPASRAAMAGMVTMSLALLALAVLAVLAAAPVAWCTVSRLTGVSRLIGGSGLIGGSRLTGVSGLIGGSRLIGGSGLSAGPRPGGTRRGGLVVPILVLVLSVAVLFVGGRHFGNGWPGTGGHPWAAGALRAGGREWVGRGLIPGGLAAFAWASTLSVSTYWLHPAALAAFPAPELAWMALSPLALAAATVAAALLVRRSPLSPRAQAFQARLAPLACAAMLAFLAGGGLWVASGAQGLFRAGTIDAAGVALLAAILALAAQAARHARLLLAR
ncbi:MAG TPA: hypothetical protein VH478_13960 [Trebonia sp.]|nr:hypothetical protein [Trebonia sp.]